MNTNYLIIQQGNVESGTYREVYAGVGMLEDWEKHAGAHPGKQYYKLTEITIAPQFETKEHDTPYARVTIHSAQAYTGGNLKTQDGKITFYVDTNSRQLLETIAKSLQPKQEA